METASADIYQAPGNIDQLHHARFAVNAGHCRAQHGQHRRMLRQYADLAFPRRQRDKSRPALIDLPGHRNNADLQATSAASGAQGCLESNERIAATSIGICRSHLQPVRVDD